MARTVAKGASEFKFQIWFIFKFEFPPKLWDGIAMALPQVISSLLYCFNHRDQVLLMERVLPPNQGCWSPSGGKLEVATGESPHQNAAREASEELGIIASPTDFHLVGIVSEQAGGADPHWLMFLLELKPRLDRLPAPHREGRFQFFRREELGTLTLPQTDREKIWPLFWEHRGGFFAASCQTRAGENLWSVEQSNPRPAPIKP